MDKEGTPPVRWCISRSGEGSAPLCNRVANGNLLSRSSADEGGTIPAHTVMVNLRRIGNPLQTYEVMNYATMPVRPGG